MYRLGDWQSLRREAVGHDFIGVMVSFKRSPYKFQSSLLVPGPGNGAFEHFAFVIDGSPEVVLFAIDLHEHLVEVPAPAARSHALDPLIADLRGEHWPEPVPPEPHRFLADVDAPSCSRSSTLRSERGKRMYIIAARRMISGLVLK